MLECGVERQAEGCEAETALVGRSADRHHQRRNRVLKDTIELFGGISQAEIRRNYVQVLEYHTDEAYRVVYEMNTRIPDIMRTAIRIRIDDVWGPWRGGNTVRTRSQL